MVNRNPNSDNELASKKYVDDSIGQGNDLIFNQILENYLKVSFGNDTYNPTKNEKIRNTDTTIFICPNTGSYLLQNWIMKCNDNNNKGKIQNITKNQEKPTHQRLIHEQRVYLRSLIVLCFLKQVLIIMMIMFLSVPNEQILYNLLIKYSILTDFQF